MHLKNLMCVALLLALTFTGGASLQAAPKFTSAEVTKVVNEVNLLTGTKTSRPAKKGSVIKGSTAVRTGQKSRTQLEFPDDSIVRLGSNSVFSFAQGKRKVDLEKGTLLMQVPKSRGRTSIKSAAVSAAITGTTILFEFVPEHIDKFGVWHPGRVKIIVVEGKLECSLDTIPGKTIKLEAGDMIAFEIDTKKLPKKFKIDLKKLVGTALLIDGGLGQLPELEPVDREVGAQDEQKRFGKLLIGGNYRQPRPRGRILSRLIPGRRIDQARVVTNARPRIITPPVRTTPGPGGGGNPQGGGNNGGVTGGGGRAPITLPDRPPRNPPTGAP